MKTNKISSIDFSNFCHVLRCKLQPLWRRARDNCVRKGCQMRQKFATFLQVQSDQDQYGKPVTRFTRDRPWKILPRFTAHTLRDEART